MTASRVSASAAGFLVLLAVAERFAAALPRQSLDNTLRLPSDAEKPTATDENLIEYLVRRMLNARRADSEPNASMAANVDFLLRNADLYNEMLAELNNKPVENPLASLLPRYYEVAPQTATKGPIAPVASDLGAHLRDKKFIDIDYARNFGNKRGNLLRLAHNSARGFGK